MTHPEAKNLVSGQLVTGLHGEKLESPAELQDDPKKFFPVVPAVGGELHFLLWLSLDPGPGPGPGVIGLKGDYMRVWMVQCKPPPL